MLNGETNFSFIKLLKSWNKNYVGYLLLIDKAEKIIFCQLSSKPYRKRFSIIFLVFVEPGHKSEDCWDPFRKSVVSK